MKLTRLLYVYCFEYCEYCEEKTDKTVYLEAVYNIRTVGNCTPQTLKFLNCI